MEEIGLPVPRGVVDVHENFVGIHPQEMNPHKELARLRKQVRQIRTRHQNKGLISRDTEQRTIGLARLAMMIGLAGFAFALWRSKRF